MKKKYPENRLNLENTGTLKAAGKEICLLNDAFPPVIDGVSNVVVNYARVLKNDGYSASVVTPENAAADDSGYEYPVIRYPGIDLTKQIGYTAGNPFSMDIVKKLAGRKIGVLHSHCPVMSNFLARELRETLDVPLILTYHTKFDIDIVNIMKLEPVQDGMIRGLVESVSACDELWAVSRGAGESIRSLGYTGDYIVMPNGVDTPRQRAPEQDVKAATDGYDLPENIPLFLFVGRMMWYKGLRIILEALAALWSQRLDFRMVFVGGGSDLEEVQTLCTQLGLNDRCFFTGSVHDRSALAAWYTRADLLLFPSTFDTNGLVVREAAACSLGTVLVRDSCAAEGVTDGRNGFLIDQNAASLAVCLTLVMRNREAMHRVGESASAELYLSWDDAVKKAEERYEIVAEKYRAGEYARHRDFADRILKIPGEMLEAHQKLDRVWGKLLSDLNGPQ